MNGRFIQLIGVVAFFLIMTISNAQVTTQWGPDGFVKIEEGSGGFFASLDPGDRFSRDHDQAGDINGDGIIDMVVGARSDDDGATDAGAVYILFMNNDGTVQSNQKISALEGGFDDTLLENNYFGYGVAGIGDYDDDNIPDIAVTATSSSNVALYIIHLNSNGTVKDYVKTPNIIGQGMSSVGDLNNDGRIDLVVCNPGSDVGGVDVGAISILFFDTSSELIAEETVLINPMSGGFGTGLESGDQFGGREVAMLGDIDNDGSLEMAVGAFNSDGGKGAIWMLSLDSNTLNVVSKLKITEGLNGFTDALTLGTNPNGSQGANFGHALCKIGDLNGDGIPDLMTGANQQNEGWGYILYLNADKTVKTFTRLTNTEGGFDFSFTQEERFSRSISFLGDLRGDGTVAVNYGGGAGGGPDGEGATGSLYLLFFKPCEFNQEAGFNQGSDENVVFSNWDSNMEDFSSEPLTFEQCTFKAFETDANYLTHDLENGQCSCFDENATFIVSNNANLLFTNGCFNSDESTGINEITKVNSAVVYPNPAHSSFKLKTATSTFTTQDRIWLFSLLGKELLSASIVSQQTEVDIAELAQGTYVVKAIISGTVSTFIIVKE